MSNATTDRYTIISADCHAGGSHEQYRDFLEARYLPDFDAWRNKYKNPFRDLQDGGRIRNWDDTRRIGDQEDDGVVAEVVFPNTIPPFFPSFVLFARPPREDQYELRLAGIRAHNRWLADFCGRHPERRAGIGQIFLNDVDDALDDLKFIRDNNLRGGVLISAIPPDVDYVKPLYDPCYEPIWQFCEDNNIIVNSHGGTGNPSYGKYSVSDLLFITEVSFYSQRPFVQLLLSGVFERHPNLKFVMTEQGCAWLVPMLDHFDSVIDKIRRTGRMGEMVYSEEHALKQLASDYFRQNCWVGVSQPSPADAAAREVLGVDKFMWGSDYPHNEGTHPFTREHLRALFSATPEAEMRQILAGNTADLYGFDLAALAPHAAKAGPTVAELAVPLTEMPENPNEALIKSVKGRY